MAQFTPVTVEKALAANSVAVGNTLIPAGAIQSYARFQNKDASALAYWTEDGSDPSATNGTALQPGQSYEYPTERTLPNGPIRWFSTGTPRINAVYG